MKTDYEKLLDDLIDLHKNLCMHCLGYDLFDREIDNMQYDNGYKTGVVDSAYMISNLIVRYILKYDDERKKANENKV